MRRIYSVMRSIDRFIQFTPNSNQEMICNDLFLVYVRNVELTSKQGGVKKLNNLLVANREQQYYADQIGILLE